MESKILQQLTESFTKMPTIGIRTAERLAYYVVNAPDRDIANLINAIKQVKQKVKYCKTCFNLADNEYCEICTNDSRDRSIICVVEQLQDIASIEKTGIYNGVYHILLGVLSPLDGKGPADLKIGELIKRIKDSDGKVKEVIIATNPNINGEATALYLTKSLQQFNIKISRIGFGLAMGSDISYSDKSTILNSLEGRRSL